MKTQYLKKKQILKQTKNVNIKNKALHVKIIYISIYICPPKGIKIVLIISDYLRV